MAIDFNQYVDITSGVGGAAVIAERELIGRIFTTNTALSVGDVVEYSTTAEVLAVFGSTSDEYKIAQFYFGWISKNITSPKKISFARWDDINETITEVLTTSTAASNNFGSFGFISTLTQAEVAEAALWNDTQNNMFMYCAPVAAADAATLNAAVIGYSGIGVTLNVGTADEWPEFAPMVILAATNYAKRNSVQNYMFQQFSLTPSVTDTTTATTYDGLRVNYYGSTQTAGQTISFYQRGTMMGGSTDATDMNTYANEMWLKSAAGAAIGNLLLAMPKISANANGRAQLINIMQSVIERALTNGSISVGKPLSATQKAYIAEVTGDDKAYVQIQSIGYWLDCSIESYVTTDSRTEWKAVYTLLYAKDDVIRKVEGTDTLI